MGLFCYELEGDAFNVNVPRLNSSSSSSSFINPLGLLLASLMV